MLCFPSVQALSSTTEQDRKTVMDNLQRLREMGFIEDTGARRGITGQVPVYRLKSPESGAVKTGQPPPSYSPNSTEIPSPNSTENGTGTKNGTVPVFPPNSTVFPIEQYRFSHETVPKTGHGTRKEQGIEQGRNKEKSVCASMPGVPDQLFSDYLAVRKAKKAGPLTTTAINGLMREAEKAGKTLEEAVTICCERGWQSLKAEWLTDRQGAARGTAATGETAYQRSMRERIEEAAPSIARRAPAQQQDATDYFRTVDVTARDVTRHAIEVQP